MFPGEHLSLTHTQHLATTIPKAHIPNNQCLQYVHTCTSTKTVPSANEALKQTPHPFHPWGHPPFAAHALSLLTRLSKGALPATLGQLLI